MLGGCGHIRKQNRKRTRGEETSLYPKVSQRGGRIISRLMYAPTVSTQNGSVYRPGPASTATPQTASSARLPIKWANPSVIDIKVKICATPSVVSMHVARTARMGGRILKPMETITRPVTKE